MWLRVAQVAGGGGCEHKPSVSITCVKCLD